MKVYLKRGSSGGGGCDPELPPSQTNLLGGDGVSRSQLPEFQPSSVRTVRHRRQAPVPHLPRFTDLSNGSEHGAALHDGGRAQTRRWCRVFVSPQVRGGITVRNGVLHREVCLDLPQSVAAHLGGGLAGQGSGTG